jgi:hypothetical protein
MSAFGGLIMTNKGRALQAKAQTGVNLTFTRIGIGDGNLNGQSILDLNALVSEKKSLTLTKLKIQPGGKAVVGTVLSNQDITSGFYFREIGVFAQDPDVGEILYCYGNAGPNAEYIPAGGGPDIVEKSIDVVTIVGNASNISATLDSSMIYASQTDLQNHIDDHNNPHNVTADQVGAIPVSQKGSSGGVAPLDNNALVPSANLPKASSNALGAVKIGSGINIAGDGTISVTPYTLPSDVAKTDVPQTWTAAQSFANSITSTVATGTAPFIVSSTTKVTNLNADKVDGYDFNQSLQTTDSPTFAAVTATTFTGSLSGNASTATKLQTARTIGLSGDVTATGVNFDGSANVTITTTIANKGAANGIATLDANGQVPVSQLGNVLGTNNASVTVKKCIQLDGDTRTVTLNYTSGQLIGVTITDPTNSNAVVETISLTYTNGQLTSVADTAGGHTSTLTLNYTGSQLTSITKAYV